MRGVPHVVSRVVSRFVPTLRKWIDRDRYVRQAILAPPPAVPDAVAYIPDGVIGAAGIDLDLERQLALLATWQDASHQALFARLRGDPTINTQSQGRDGIRNSFFRSPDAEVYAAMIADRRPRRIVEVGAGYSTLIARATCRHVGCDTKIVIVDPSPRIDVRAAADEMILLPVEHSGLIDFPWAAGDLLFIDSSHACRTRGDLPYLYCQVLPALPAGVLVQVHDILLPYDYPNAFDHQMLTEQYLLHCTLAHSPRYRTVFATHLLVRQHGAQMRAVFGDAVGDEAFLYGWSYWFEVER